MIDFVCNKISPYIPKEEINVTSIGKVHVLEFEVFFNLKVVVMIDYITDHYSFICYDICNGGGYKLPNIKDWGVVKSMSDSSLENMTKSLESFLWKLI